MNTLQKAAFWLLGLCLVFLIGLAQPGMAAQPRHYTDLKFSPLPEMKLPDYSRFQLENGMVIYLMEDHELPLVGGVAMVRTGDRLEPSDKVGLADLTAEVMRSGGTVKHPSDELNQLLEQRAASVEASMGRTSGGVNFNCLTEDLSQVFNLFAEVIQEPAFAQEKLDLAKNQFKGSIARRNDEPDEIARREFRKLIYGAESPYARTVEYASLKRIDRPSLQQFHQQYFRPENLMLGLFGDFDSAKMKALIQAKFANWVVSTPPPAKVELAPVNQAQRGGIFFVEQPQLTQSNILMGHLAGELDSPDYPALDVMNNVLNGFGGRLFNELRSRQGLAYSVYAFWSAQYDYPGVFVAGGETRSEATVSFVQGLKAEMEKIRQSRITPAELTFAQESTLNSFVFNFERPVQVLSRLLTYEYFGYPQDFLTRYRRGVEATTIVDVERVARQYLKPEDLVVLVVGNRKDIAPPLTSLTPDSNVTTIDITIPGAG